VVYHILPNIKTSLVALVKMYICL